MEAQRSQAGAIARARVAAQCGSVDVLAVGAWEDEDITADRGLAGVECGERVGDLVNHWDAARAA